MATFQVINGKIVGGPVIPVEDMRLLWTNPNPSVAFEAQNITLASDEYDFLLWIVKQWASADTFFSEISKKGDNVNLSTAVTSSTKAIVMRRRTVNFVDDTTYYADRGYEANSVDNVVNSYNNSCIPIEVYGFKKDSLGGESAPGMKYSTNEQIVGTWIDGKPIYQKTITGTTNNSNDPLYLATGISIDKVINIEGAVCQAGDTYVFNNFWANAISSNTVLGFKIAVANNLHSTIPNNLIITASHSNYQGCPFYITVKYTKTTD